MDEHEHTLQELDEKFAADRQENAQSASSNGHATAGPFPHGYRAHSGRVTDALVDGVCRLVEMGYSRKTALLAWGVTPEQQRRIVNLTPTKSTRRKGGACHRLRQGLAIAEARARGVAEAAAHAKHPTQWLRYGPGGRASKRRKDGWTDSVNPRQLEAGQASGGAGMQRETLAVVDVARQLVAVLERKGGSELAAEVMPLLAQLTAAATPESTAEKPAKKA